jgi:virginiamycin B lyase
MRLRLIRSLLAASLATILAGTALGGAPRADAAVYWSSGGFVGAANLDGSTFVDGVPYRAANVPEIGNICGLAVSNGNLYWADSSRGTIGRMGLPASPYGYADFISERVFIDEAFISGIVNPCGVAVDGGHIYWTSSGSMSIGRANLDGSGVDRTFISGVSSPCGIAADSSHLYWGSFVGDSIGRANLGGGEVNEDFVLGAEGPCGIAVDGSHVYWSNWDSSSIGRAGIDGSAPKYQFISGLKNPCGVAVDGSHIYWTNWNARDPVGRANLDGSGVVKSLVKTEFYLASCGVALDARTFRAPPPPPSAPIFLGKRLGRGEARGVAYITVKVPNTGGVIDVLTNGLDWSLLGPPVTEGGYLLYRLKVWPAKTGRAARKIRSRLARKGRAKVTLEVTYEETGKGPFRAARPLTLFRLPIRP